jgi:hypothetical protein
VEEFVSGDVCSNTLLLAGEVELQKFIEKLRERIKQGAQSCFWEGYDLEILGDTPDQLSLLESALRDLHRKQWFSRFDLSRYAEGRLREGNSPIIRRLRVKR